MNNSTKDAAAKSQTGAEAEANAQQEMDPFIAQLPSVDDWLPAALQPGWEAISNYPLLGAAVVATSFFMLAVLLRAVLFQVLHQLVGLTHSTADDAILRDLRRPVFTSVNLLGLMLAIDIAQLPFGSQLALNLLGSIIVASWMRAGLSISTTLLDTLASGNRFSLVESRTVPLFDLTTKLLIILVGSYVLLLIWGINPVGWLASAGIVGIAVGFAAKDTLANLFSGFFIVADAPYKLGDYITLDTGERGKVSAIGLRSTRLLTRADVEITIPNGVIAAAKIVNESGGPSAKMRIPVRVGVAYGSDTDRVCKILAETGRSHTEVCTHPEAKVRMRGFGPSSLDFDLLCWIDQPQDKGRITHELYLEIYRAFAEADIEIPYAKQDVYIKEWADGNANSEQ